MAENKDRDQFNQKKDDDHLDHQISYNADVTDGGTASSGESSSARDVLSNNQRKRIRSLPVLGCTEKINGVFVPVYYSETMLPTPTSYDSVISQSVKSLSVEEYNDYGLDEKEFLTDDNLVGIVVGPFVQEGDFVDFRCEPIYGEGTEESSFTEKDVSDHDQQGSSISKDPKKGKK